MKTRPAQPLAALQRAIATALQHPPGRNDAMAPAAAAVAAEFIKPNDRLTSFERLQIYHQQYWWRLLGALEEDFNGLRAVLGPKKFDRLALAYLTAHPSTSWTLRDLGQYLVAFLQQHPALTHPHGALALDVARVEWARVIAFDGPGRPVVSTAHLARTPPDRLRLGLQPSLTLLALAYPIDDFMRTLKRTGIAALSNAVGAAHTQRRDRLSVRRSRRPLHLAVHRVDHSVYYTRLDPEAWRLLVALRDGATVETACASAFAATEESPEHSAARIQEWFSRWMQFGWFCPAPRAAAR